MKNNNNKEDKQEVSYKEEKHRRKNNGRNVSRKYAQISYNRLSGEDSDLEFLDDYDDEDFEKFSNRRR